MNMKMKMNIILSAILVGLWLQGCSGNGNPTPPTPEQKTTTITYQASDDQFPSPERGFFRMTSCNLGTGFTPLSESTLRGYRASNYSLIFRYFYMKDFRNNPLTDQALSQFDTDMATIRSAGMKCIVRFAYSSAANEPDAPLSTILQHIEQLKPHLEKNVDVIFVMQAGFIGSWGEWYYTTNNLNTSSARYQVLSAVLAALPTSRMVQVRTLAYKKEFTGDSNPLTQAEAFTGKDKARNGHHNDCFLASSTDYGSYTNPTTDKAYLTQDCLYVPIGGETCPPDGVDPADGLTAYNTMRQLRFTFLNSDYYTPVNNLWTIGGYMDRIMKELGYRFVLTSGEYTTGVAPGGTFTAKIILRNVGFAPLYNERSVELVLKNAATNEVYKARLDVEPRFWKPIDTQDEIDATVGIPTGMPAGDYTLYLNMPDKAETLQNNPDYSVRFANTSVWEASTGYNNLYVTINVASNNASTPYSGSLYFSK
jgi:hypothetical protein